MNKIQELHALPNGTDVEIQGRVAYDSAPKPVRYGEGFNQFVVVSDGEGETHGIGCNIPMSTEDQGYAKGNTVTIKGKLDKYADRKQPLKPDGTFPIKTSVRVTFIEEFTQVDDFPDAPANATPVELPGKPPVTIKAEPVMDKEDLKEAEVVVKKNGYSQSKEEERKMWEAKDLIVAKQSACKTVGKWIDSGRIELKDYFKWCDKLVDFFYNKDDGFTLITEVNLMKSGLVSATKAEILSWITEHMKGTDIETDPCGILHVKALDKQTVAELLDTAEKVSLAI